MTTPLPALPAPYLRQVLAHPDDDGPRLCAADWWDERGVAARAEFVRVQCELAVLSLKRSCQKSCSGCRPWPKGIKRPYEPKICARGRRLIALRRRERELYRGEWDAEVIPVGWATADESYPAFVYRRGFVEEITCPAADFLAHAEAIRAACPLKRVRLTAQPDLRVNRGYTYSLPGRPVALARWGGESWDSFVLRLLAAEFPGIGFEMPAVGFRPGSLSPSQVPLTTDDRGSPPRPSWSTRTY